MSAAAAIGLSSDRRSTFMDNGSNSRFFPVASVSIGIADIHICLASVLTPLPDLNLPLARIFSLSLSQFHRDFFSAIFHREHAHQRLWRFGAHLHEAQNRERQRGVRSHQCASFRSPPSSYIGIFVALTVGCAHFDKVHLNASGTV